MRPLFEVLDDMEDVLKQCRAVIHEQQEQINKLVPFNEALKDTVVVISKSNIELALRLRKQNARIEKMKVVLDRRLEIIKEQEAQLNQADLVAYEEPQLAEDVVNHLYPDIKHKVALQYWDPAKDYVTFVSLSVDFKLQDEPEVHEITYHSYEMARKERYIKNVQETIFGLNWITPDNAMKIAEHICKFRYDLKVFPYENKKPGK